MNNKQEKNVGNIGDILKHAYLVQAASSLVHSDPAPISFLWIDTHTFLLHHTCAYQWDAWEATLGSSSYNGEFEGGYKPYVDAERAFAREHA